MPQETEPKAGEQAGKQKAAAPSDAHGDRAQAAEPQGSGVDDQDPLSAHPS